MSSPHEPAELSSEEEVEPEGYETDLSSVGDISEFIPIPHAIRRGFQRLASMYFPTVFVYYYVSALQQF